MIEENEFDVLEMEKENKWKMIRKWNLIAFSFNLMVRFFKMFFPQPIIFALFYTD